MEHIISVTVENKFGVLSRVAGLFSGRGFNIESLSVAPTLDPSMSQMTIVTSGDERIIEQIVKQLNKLIDVIKVVDLNETEFVSRETAIIKVHTRDADYKGHTHHASNDEPQYEIKSDKTDHVAMHKGSALSLKR